MQDYEATAEYRAKEKTLRHGISIKNFWATPLDVFDALDQEFDFDLDAAAEAESAKCRNWLGPGHPDPARRDALTGPPWPGRRVFLNPPYSPDGGTIFRWVARAHLEAQSKEHVVLLLPGTADTDWAQFCYEHADDIRFTPRIRFVDPAGGRINPMGGSMVVVMRPADSEAYHLRPDERTAHVSFGYAPWKGEP